MNGANCLVYLQKVIIKNESKEHADKETDNSTRSDKQNRRKTK